ncbi:hypothetical protein, partial [Metasolibacillus meyeri]|uniref:hypothetical protein n=1 Tax=Metasolibacillus meyeri TaxID=1071052 RepID=UPI001EE74B84
SLDLFALFYDLSAVLSIYLRFSRFICGSLDLFALSHDLSALLSVYLRLSMIYLRFSPFISHLPID